jgi:RNA polymerase sigma-70 factor, ECF subfamily
MSQKIKSQPHNGTAALTAQSFSTLHDQYRGRVLSSMIAVARNREEAEDITATAFVAAFKNLHSFRGESSLQTWIHAIALNEARNRRRSPRILLESIEESDAFQVADPDATVAAFEQRECCPQIWKALNRVPRFYRRVLIDRFVRGYSMKQIAKHHRVPLGTVLSRLFKAKRLLRSAWKR